MKRTACLLGALFTAVIGASPPVRGSDLPVVFVSIPPQKFVVEELAGQQVQVEVMLPPGGSPATYEPTPRQMAALDGAELYLQIGAPFEAPILDRVRTLMPDLEVVDCRTGISLEPMEEHHHGHEAEFLDPHIWLDPHRMKTIAQTTAASLRRLIPGMAAGISGNLQRLLDALDATDRKIASVLEPVAGRELLVFHPAYGYFARRYGLVQRAVESEGKAPSARRLAEIVAGLEKSNTSAIFIQPQFSQTTARRVADALDCQIFELDPLAEDYLVNLETMANRIATAMVN